MRFSAPEVDRKTIILYTHSAVFKEGGMGKFALGGLILVRLRGRGAGAAEIRCHTVMITHFGDNLSILYLCYESFFLFGRLSLIVQT